MIVSINGNVEINGGLASVCSDMTSMFKKMREIWASEGRSAEDFERDVRLALDMSTWDEKKLKEETVKAVRDLLATIFGDDAAHKGEEEPKCED